MPTAPKKVEPKDSKKSKHDDKDEAQAFLKELEKKKEANPDACIFC